MDKEDFLEEEALYQDRDGKDQAIVWWARVEELRWMCVTLWGSPVALFLLGTPWLMVLFPGWQRRRLPSATPMKIVLWLR